MPFCHILTPRWLPGLNQVNGMEMPGHTLKRPVTRVLDVLS